MKNKIPNTVWSITLFFCTLVNSAIAQKTVYLDDLDLSKIVTGWSYARKNTNLLNKPISLGGKVFERGVCVHATSIAQVKLSKGSKLFTSTIALDDVVSKLGGKSVEVSIVGDGKKLYHLPVLAPGETPKNITLDVHDVDILSLEVYGINGTHHTHFVWGDAKFEVTGKSPEMYLRPREAAIILTPPVPKWPKINGPKVYGVRPGSPMNYYIPVTGERPISITIQNMPHGLSFNASTGCITGVVETAGDYTLQIKATNRHGADAKTFTIKCGTLIGLTPPMGWNSWNSWGMSVDEDKVKKAADFMVSTGLINYGWTYINIDDGWQGPSRDSITGVIQTDPIKFPDLKSLADYVHDKNLKIGIYSSPGHLTCGKRIGSLLYEDIDAATYANWGIDYLKYDKCSFGQLFGANDKHDQIRAYGLMNSALKSHKRDIIYSLCQYGGHNVWQWADKVEGNCWRTTDDIVDTWLSMTSIGFNQDHNASYARPGRFNDPDMLVLGKVAWNEKQRNTNLTPNEQYTHFSLWCLLSAPLLLGCDLSQIDDFTLSLLTNAEVLAVNQDELGKQATTVLTEDPIKVYMKPLADGTFAVGIFNTSITDMPFTLQTTDLKLNGKYTFRDLWRQKNVGKGTHHKAIIPLHGVLLLKLTPIK